MIWSIITTLFSEAGGYIIAGLGFVAAIVAARWSGVKSERQKNKVKDHEKAQEIRDRVRHAPDDSVRKYDDAGRRDD